MPPWRLPDRKSCSKISQNTWFPPVGATYVSLCLSNSFNGGKKSSQIAQHGLVLSQTKRGPRNGGSLFTSFLSVCPARTETPLYTPASLTSTIRITVVSPILVTKPSLFCFDNKYCICGSLLGMNSNYCMIETHLYDIQKGSHAKMAQTFA